MRNLDYIINQINGNNVNQEEIVNEVQYVVDEQYEDQSYEYNNYDGGNEEMEMIPLWNNYEEESNDWGYADVEFDEIIYDDNNYYDPYNEGYQYDNYQDDPFYNNILDASEYVEQEPIVYNYEFDDIDRMVLEGMIDTVSENIEDLVNGLDGFNNYIDELLFNDEAIVFNDKSIKEKEPEKSIVKEEAKEETNVLEGFDGLLDELLVDGDEIKVEDKVIVKEEAKDNSGINMDAIYEYMSDDKRKYDTFNKPYESEDVNDYGIASSQNDLVNSIIRDNTDKMKTKSVDFIGEYENDNAWVNDSDLFGNNYMHCIAENENEVHVENDFVEGSFGEWMEQHQSNDDFYYENEGC